MTILPGKNSCPFFGAFFAFLRGIKTALQEPRLCLGCHRDLVETPNRRMSPSSPTASLWPQLLRCALLCLAVIPVVAGFPVQPTPEAPVFPVAEMGLPVDPVHEGVPVGVESIPPGARLWSEAHKLSATVDAKGLHLESTEPDGGDLRLVSRSMGRTESPTVFLPESGRVEAQDALIRFVRSGLIEEYTASQHGIRQDFLVTHAPAGSGFLRLGLSVAGARASALAQGVRLDLEASGRSLEYHRLHVTDAMGRILEASWEVEDAGRIAIRVIDTDAQYPIRIDPTFSNADWSALGSGIGNFSVLSVLKSGSDLYVGGSFTSPGNRVAKWDGSSWSSLGAGFADGEVRALAMVGTTLYAGGTFTIAGGSAANYLAKWNGSSWSAVGSGIAGGSRVSVEALVAGGSDLYVAGEFTTAGGSMANNIAKWNGSTWSSFGTGLNRVAYDLAFIESTLYVVGYFNTAGGISAERVAQWNGSSWAPMGSGLTQSVYKVAVMGGDLYAAGNFTTLNYVAKWDGSSWTALGSGVDGTVRAMAVEGTDLYVGGFFTNADGNSANRIARWDGTSWTAVGSGADSTVRALGVGGTTLYVGGIFTTAGGQSINRIAQVALGCHDPTSGGDIDGDQSGNSPFSPAALTSVSGASGQRGTLEYQWQSSTTGSSSGFSDITGANATTYAPGSLTQNTWFRRLARVDCRSDWTGAVASDVVQITVIGPASQLALTTTAAGAAAGAAFTTQPVVVIRDSAGNTVTSDSTSVVTLTVSSGATVVGTATATAASGVATFSTVGLSGPAASYTLTFSSGSLTTATQSIVLPNSAPVPLNPTVSRSSKTLKILLTSLATDANLDTLTFSALSSATGATVTTSGGYLLYTVSVSGASQNDTVSYTVSDGSLSGNGTLTLTYTGANQSGQAQNVTVIASQVTVRFAGIPGFSYRVQRADDAGFSLNVTLSSPITIPASGLYTYTDPAPPVSSAYYRLVAN